MFSQDNSPDFGALQYSHCSDWCIFAKDPFGNLWFVVTEMWEEWLDLQEGADSETDAVNKYMLPIALQKWQTLNWQICL